MRRVWLSVPIARRDAVTVCVPLDGMDTVFVEAGHDAPDGDHFATHADAPGVSLRSLLLALAPARSDAITRHLDALAAIDNRIDLEAALRALAAWIEHGVALHRARDDGWRRSQARALGGWLPEMVHLLDEATLRVDADPPAELMVDHEGGGTRASTDDEHWDAWKVREVEEILGTEGALRRLIGDGFEFRPGQRDMAEAVSKVLERQEHLMVEAGTGIGKSLAYLVPALLHGARTGERVVVSTYTRTLQSQLVDHDLPLLESLGYPGGARLLLGRNNYLCRRQLRRASQTRVDSAEQALALFALARWGRESREGRREELVDHPWFEPYWRVFFESVEPCSPHICHRDPVCFVVRARRRAREAPVVIVNHALLMMDLRSGQSLVGPSRVLIVDEAHQLNDVATRALSHWIAPERLEVYRNLSGDRPTPGAMREVFGHVVSASGGAGEVEEAARTTDRALERFLDGFLTWFTALAELARDRLGGEVARPGAHRIHDPDEAFGTLRERRDALRETAKDLERALALLLTLGSEHEEHGASVAEEREGLATLLEFHREFAAQVDFCQRVDDEDWVYWLEWGGNVGLRALVAAPLTVESPLASLWNDHYRSVVMTSATLAVESEFLPFAEKTGIKLYTSLMYLKSVTMVRYLNNLPGVPSIPQEFLKSMMQAPVKQEAGMQVAADFLKELEQLGDGTVLLALGWRQRLPDFLDMIER